MSEKDSGYAAASAMLAAAAFALIAAQVARTSKSEVQSAAAQAARSHLEADIDAALAVTLANLAADGSRRWGPQDAPRVLAYDDARLLVTIEDECGKIPLNTITRTQVEAMFRAAGAPPERVAALRDAFLDWRDPQRADRTRPVDPTRPGGFSSIQELLDVDGVDPSLFNTLAPAITVSNASTSFRADAATALAFTVMQGAEAGSVRSLERSRELSGERTALSVSNTQGYTAGPLTVRIEAKDALGDTLARAFLVETTTSANRRVVLRGALPVPFA